jgi:hypothetical protein
MMPSVTVAEQIKELDMSMPSYGEIKEPTASAANAKSLTVEPPKRGSSAAREAQSFVPSSFLPSMGKMSAADKAAAAAMPKIKTDSNGYAL